ncbi:HNH endonuclease [Microcella alkaliphila]|uniref:HNH endonuclease n=1 Tax=Microcella alkaliphila TaxID=279828 RepID=A0A4Q7U2E4_9MICO|nr:HNH endonuclease signature motif containing protein [Microcella alkaliphila]RZT66442.1 HNH endonuclease [Microcella alkaliphila]
MPNSNAVLTSTLVASLVETEQPFAAPAVDGLSDDELISLQRLLAEVRRRADAAAASVAAAVAYRSRHELGHDGLAQRLGARTPQKLVQTLTGGSARDAAALVRVGSLLDAQAEAEAQAADEAAGVAPAESRQPRRPWLDCVTDAVSRAQLTIEQASAIQVGLGEPDTGACTHPSHREPTNSGDGTSHVCTMVTAAQLAEAARALVACAPAVTVEQLAARAREARAVLDADADVERAAEAEQARRDRRYLYLTQQPDGMTRLSGLLDPESAALVRSAIDGATSPRRGGPRFVSETEIERAERIINDTRTTEQIAVDALVELVRIGGHVAPTEVIGVAPPAVQVIVAERDLRAGAGLARVEGQSEPVSVATAERHRCTAGTLAVVVDDAGDVLSLGREIRLYTRRQRLALAARDGGCRFPGCERPPSWTEAHHITEWMHGGRTDIANGILLCRHHHLLLHNNGWQIERHPDTGFAFRPPPGVDPSRTPIPAPTKSRVLPRAI